MNYARKCILKLVYYFKYMLSLNNIKQIYGVSLTSLTLNEIVNTHIYMCDTLVATREKKICILLCS